MALSAILVLLHFINHYCIKLLSAHCIMNYECNIRWDPQFMPGCLYVRIYIRVMCTEDTAASGYSLGHRISNELQSTHTTEKYGDKSLWPDALHKLLHVYLEDIKEG